MMRKAEVHVSGVPAGYLEEKDEGAGYVFQYVKGYRGAPVSLTMPVRPEEYDFSDFPAFFDGLLPEGVQLESLLRTRKIDRNDYFSQLVAVGSDMVGTVTVKEVIEEI